MHTCHTEHTRTALMTTVIATLSISSTTMSRRQLRVVTDPRLSTQVEQLVPGVHAGQRAITLGEGALWHSAGQRFVYVDIEAPALCFYTPRTQAHESYNLQQLLEQQYTTKVERIPKIGTVVATSDVNLYLIAIQHETHGLSLFNYTTHQLTPYVPHPEYHLQNNRYNDGKCSPDGKLFVGTMLLDTIQPRTPEGSLYAVNDASSGDQLRGSIQKVLSQVTISNGIVWSNDSTRMYYIDTPRECVEQFTYDVASGSIDVSSRRAIIRTTYEQDGYPDGMTIDSEGKLWVAFWQGSNVSRFDPDTGALLHRISLPTQCITSVAFGGDDLQDLYITSANNKVDIQKEPQAGSVFIVRNVGVKGVHAPVYTLKAKL